MFSTYRRGTATGPSAPSTCYFDYKAIRHSFQCANINSKPKSRTEGVKESHTVAFYYRSHARNILQFAIMLTSYLHDQVFLLIISCFIILPYSKTDYFSVVNMTMIKFLTYIANNFFLSSGTVGLHLL